MSWRSVVVLTIKDVVAAGLTGVVVLGEHPRQGPDNHGVNGEDVPQVFVQNRILQDEPAGKPSVFVIVKIQPHEVVLLLFFNSPNKQNHSQKRERKSDRVFRGHFCVFDQHDAQINQRGNRCPGGVYGDPVLNLWKTDAETVCTLRLGTEGHECKRKCAV